ncbi:MAG TPA: NAD-dependent epimerase/dehydratase family protein [candidate division Zixibacteria bacterium]|nr:NAD-dependent epimerase/dehydratase family protein [candidate division Zixibacteria bacterium]
MDILILGGTQFVGKHITAAALKNNHNVTLFNRGKTNTEPIDGVTTLIGDRDGNLDALKGKKFDAVIDVCGYLPRVVKQSAELLKKLVPHYVFISTISVYDHANGEPIDIDSPLATLEDESTEEITGETYGGLKVLCEDEILEIYEENATIIRPGYIVGPDDHTDRFGYWIRRVANGGEMLVPENDDQPMQFIDVRDLAEWTIRLTEKKQAGIYNAVGPNEKLTLADLLVRMKKHFNSDSKFIKVSKEFIDENEISVTDFPMLFSFEDTAHYNFMEIELRPSISQGLTHRTVEDTIQASYTYIKSLPSDYEFKCGLSDKRHDELLKKVER